MRSSHVRKHWWFHSRSATHARLPRPELRSLPCQARLGSREGKVIGRPGAHRAHDLLQTPTARRRQGDFDWLAASTRPNPLASDLHDLRDFRPRTYTDLTRLRQYAELTRGIVAPDSEHKPCHEPQRRFPPRRLIVLICRNFLERMKGLEPSTFCMANGGSRSRLFAPVRSNPLIAGGSVQTSERDRTRANVEPCHPCHRIRTPTSDSRACSPAAGEPFWSRPFHARQGGE
jgi:hypothetical protein